MHDFHKRSYLILPNPWKIAIGVEWSWKARIYLLDSQKTKQKGFFQLSNELGQAKKEYHEVHHRENCISSFESGKFNMI